MTDVWVLSLTGCNDRTEVLAVTLSEDKAIALLHSHALENNAKLTNPDDPRYDWSYTNGWYSIIELKVTPDD